MGKDLVSGIIAIITTVIGVAIIAVLVSQKAGTANILTSGGNALSSIINAAVSPISGGSSSTSGLQVTNFPGVSNSVFG